MTGDIARVKEAILKTLDDLPAEQVAEVWDFAAFLRARAQKAKIPHRASPVSLRPAPADCLLGLTGIVSLGGDAMVDTEAVYDEDLGNP